MALYMYIFKFLEEDFGCYPFSLSQRNRKVACTNVSFLPLVHVTCITDMKRIL